MYRTQLTIYDAESIDNINIFNAIDSTFNYWLNYSNTYLVGDFWCHTPHSAGPP